MTPTDIDRLRELASAAVGCNAEVDYSPNARGPGHATVAAFHGAFTPKNVLAVLDERTALRTLLAECLPWLPADDLSGRVRAALGHTNG